MFFRREPWLSFWSGEEDQNLHLRVKSYHSAKIYSFLQKWNFNATNANRCFNTNNKASKFWENESETELKFLQINNQHLLAAESCEGSAGYLRWLVLIAYFSYTDIGSIILKEQKTRIGRMVSKTTKSNPVFLLKIEEILVMLTTLQQTVVILCKIET